MFVKVLLIFSSFFIQGFDHYQEAKCEQINGNCENENICTTSTLSGYCPTQPEYIKCCLPSDFDVKSNDCGCGYEYAGTICSGGPTAGAKKLGEYFNAKFGGYSGIYNCRPIAGGRRLSLHGEGRAVDVMISGAKGQQAFDYAISIACKTGIQEVIFNRSIWTNGQGTHPYHGKNPHVDHVHIGLNRCGAQKWGV